MRGRCRRPPPSIHLARHNPLPPSLPPLTTPILLIALQSPVSPIGRRARLHVGANSPSTSNTTTTTLLLLGGGNSQADTKKTLPGSSLPPAAGPGTACALTLPLLSVCLVRDRVVSFAPQQQRPPFQAQLSAFLYPCSPVLYFPPTLPLPPSPSPPPPPPLSSPSPTHLSISLSCVGLQSQHSLPARDNDTGPRHAHQTRQRQTCCGQNPQPWAPHCKLPAGEITAALPPDLHNNTTLIINKYPVPPRRRSWASSADAVKATIALQPPPPTTATTTTSHPTTEPPPSHLTATAVNTT